MEPQKKDTSMKKAATAPAALLLPPVGGFMACSMPSAASAQSALHAVCAMRQLSATHASPGARESAAVAMLTCAAANGMRERTQP